MCQAICILSHLIFITNQWPTHYYLHFIHEETGPKVKLLVQGNTPNKSQWDLNPPHAGSKPLSIPMIKWCLSGIQPTEFLNLS